MKTSTPAVGFTLIEVLTVIAIIAILMSLLMPTLTMAKQRARIVKSKGDLTEIVGEVKAFYTDYGTYPILPGAQVTGSGAGSNYTYGDQAGSGAQATNNYLFDILRAYQGTSNTAGIVAAVNTRLTPYADIPNVGDSKNPKSGITTQTVGNVPEGSFIDPWGQPYNVRIDASYANEVFINPPYTNSTMSVGYLATGVIAWSYGPDQAPGAGGNGDMTLPNFDDVLSWRN